MNENVKRLLKKERYSFADLCTVTALLRSEGGCPWDRAQTHESVRNCMIEEAYEAVEAIDRHDPVLLCEELGDVLFQSVFHAQLAQEEGAFTIDDVVNGVTHKMIDRHPQVFGEALAMDTAQALQAWEASKAVEKQRNTLSARLRAVPPMLPALMRAQKIAKKAGLTDGTSIQDLCGALADFFESNEAPTAEMIGGALLTICRLAELCGVNAEEALTKTTERAIEQAENAEKIGNL